MKRIISLVNRLFLSKTRQNLIKLVLSPTPITGGKEKSLLIATCEPGLVRSLVKSFIFPGKRQRHHIKEVERPTGVHFQVQDLGNITAKKSFLIPPSLPPHHSEYNIINCTNTLFPPLDWLTQHSRSKILKR